MPETPRYEHPPILMRLRIDGKELEKAGDFRWSVDNSGKRKLVLMIPASGNNVCYSTWSIGRPDDRGTSWTWDGNTARPTLRPSLHAVGVWHGWVRNGFLVEA